MVSQQGMKISSITFHDGINYGAYWQALALHEVLKDLSGKDTRIINYKNPKHFLMENLVFYHKLNKPRTIVENHRKIRKFRNAQKRFNKTKFILHHSQIRQFPINIVVFGSDEIWNYKNPLFGYDPVYFGKNIKAKKIAYATSFGTIPGNTKLPKEIVSRLKNFSSIAVRDLNSQKIIKNNLKKDVPIVLDPTFLLNLDKHSTPYTNDQGYILLYCTSVTPQQQKEIIKISKKLNKIIISVGYRHNWCNKSLVAIHPDEWLGLYSGADFIITNMYHGTIFAIKNKKPFVSISTKYRKNKMNGILAQAGLENRIYKTGKMLSILNQPINYKSVNKKLNSLKKKSLNYLQESIDQ